VTTVAPIAPSGGDPTETIGAGVTFVGIGLTMLVAVCLVTLPRANAYFNTPQWTVPGSKVADLVPGTYVVFENGDDTPFFSPQNVTATSTTGRRVPVVGYSGGPERVSFDDATHVAIAQFHINRRGTYRVSIASSGRAEVVLAASPDQELLAFVGWIVLGTCCAGIAVAGMVILIRGISARRKQRRRFAQTTAR